MIPNIPERRKVGAKLTEEEKRYILSNYGKLNTSVIAKNLRLHYYKVIAVIENSEINPVGMVFNDGYDKRYQFAKSKGFKLVSDALDKYGKQGFENMYKQSLN